MLLTIPHGSVIAVSGEWEHSSGEEAIRAECQLHFLQTPRASRLHYLGVWALKSDRPLSQFGSAIRELEDSF